MLFYFGHWVEVVEVAVVLLKRGQVLVDDHLLYEVRKNNGKLYKKSQTSLSTLSFVSLGYLLRRAAMNMRREAAAALKRRRHFRLRRTRKRGRGREGMVLLSLLLLESCLQNVFLTEHST